ncbi:MAG: RsmB/NOP family class I SAM-dependent RNA methyltransferase [Lachnospiraceae bacterium]|nr:RsmB/NOP family class I SAM-dependent RNA methyltransferase [Lachnospiraceae bacterium]
MEIPAGFLEKMKESLGDEYGAFLDSLQKEEVKALRLNPLKGIHGLPENLEASWSLQNVPWEENGYYYEISEGFFPPGKHPLHDAGAYYIQEPSAMFPVSLLSPRKNEKVLDLCAAPGGKSTQTAAFMENTGLLVANEIIRSRAEILSANIERMGVRNAVVANMEPHGIAAAFPAFFDRVLVDAPCSGEGMMRRGDAARENWSTENVRMCASRQEEILNEAAKCVRPGGKLVYSTCTFSKEEDEENVEKFLAGHPDFSIIKTEKLYPHKVRGEGHFAALFERQGDAGNLMVYKCKKKSGCLPVPKQALGFLGSFLMQEAYERIDPERIISFKDSLYLLPEGMPDIGGMKVLRPGLCLGCMKKDRFEPAHSLAMALLAEDAQNVCNLPSDSPAAVSYLSGMTLSLSGEEAASLNDGWCLVTIDGISAGLGKKTGPVIKNHYPKGLRRV